MDKINAKIKVVPEDFIVEEIGEKWGCRAEVLKSSDKREFKLNLDNKNDFVVCEMEKIDIDHFSAISIIAGYLKKTSHDIGYAGTKDKRAWTSQRISVYQPDIELLKSFNHPNIVLKNFKFSKRKIKIGYLDGNRFRLVLRDIDCKEARKVVNKIKNFERFPNFFGSQRFGSVRKDNVQIGKLLLKKNFREAFLLIFDNPENLESDSEDWVKLLRRVNRKKMLMFVNSVQSKIYNEILEKVIEEDLDLGKEKIMLAGYGLNFSEGRLGEIEKEVLNKNGISLKDFDIREFSFLRMRGSYRPAFTEIDMKEISASDDDMFEGSKKIFLDFYLKSGAYATSFLENFFVVTDFTNI